LQCFLFPENKQPAFSLPQAFPGFVNPEQPKRALFIDFSAQSTSNLRFPKLRCKVLRTPAWPLNIEE
jgi:hypothetical protein